jgi:hypothetical protein
MPLEKFAVDSWEEQESRLGCGVENKTTIAGGGFTAAKARVTLFFRTAILAPGGWAPIENLPNVFAFCPLRTEVLRGDSSQRGKESRLSSRENPALLEMAGEVCSGDWRSRSSRQRGYLA